jgi:hypothetical protein
MATIKLQPSGAVVLKDGKVACTCCEQVQCCLYPADQLGFGFFEADLPETLLSGIFTKNIGGENTGAIFVSPGYTVWRQKQLYTGVYYGRAYTLFVGVLFIDQPTDDPPNFGVGNMAVYTFGMSEGFPENPNDGCIGRIIHDDFNPTYTVGGITLTRDSLCQWTGGGRTLKYNSARFKFQLDGVNKNGIQNEPNGNYGEETVT